MLGRFEARHEGQPILGLGPQLRRLLARLCLDGSHTLEQGRLLRDLWPESETPDAVRKSLQRLRALLGNEEWRLKTENASASFETAGVELDTSAFSSAI